MKILSIPRVLPALLTMGLGLAMHQSGFAAANGEISIRNFSYTLRDLDPSDGIAPSVNWDEGTLTQTVKGAETSDVRQGWGPDVIFEGPTAKQVFTGQVDASHATGLPGFEASSGPDGWALTVDAPVQGAWAMEQLYTARFVLSPNTSLTITATGQAAVDLVMPEGAVIDLGGGKYDNGYNLGASMQNSLVGGLFLTRSEELSYIQHPSDCLSCTDSDVFDLHARSFVSTSRQVDEALSVTFTNSGNVSMPQYLGVLLQQNGYALEPRSLVPEAATWAQMALGMAGLAALIRRRRLQRTIT